MKQSTDLNATYKSGTEFPIGEEPSLVRDIRCSAVDQNGQILIKMDIEFEEQKTIHITLPEKSVRQMCLLLENIARNAHWLAPERHQMTQSVEQEKNPAEESAVRKLH